MKFFVFLPLFLLLLAGCGDELNGRKRMSNSSNPLQHNQFVSAQLLVPEQNYGGAIAIQYNGTSYRIGSQSDPQAKTLIEAQAPGTYQVQVRGWLDQESGHPNPNASYAVIHVLEIR